MLLSNEQTSFLYSANGDFIAELYRLYADNPAAVDPSWRSFFEGLHDDARSVLEEMRGASWSPAKTEKVILKNGHESQSAARQIAASGIPTDTALLDSLRAIWLIRIYRMRGHLLANLDPLGLTPMPYRAELDPKTYGFTEGDYDRPIFVDGTLGFQQATLREIMERLRATYCGSIGIEYAHIQDPEQTAWLQKRVEESGNAPRYDTDAKHHILERLTAGEGFEKFLATKFVGVKRFGLEGGEAMMPALDAAIAKGASLGLKEVVIGMAHRGRLNVLTNFLGKPFTAMFAEFQGAYAYPDSVQGSGDVKYHLGTSIDRDFGGQMVHLTMNANPSHLEWVNPVVIGRVRAKQQQRAGGTTVSDTAAGQVMALLLHGDAAFAGQGVVAETLMLSELKGYKTGGTLHFVINNQVGFTTGPQYARSGVYCTDVAKMIQAPIFHVNGDDVEAVTYVAELAAEFRQKFHKDVVIDMVCYRRHGHNEGDEPAFTQPIMYRKIKEQPTTREVYAKKLVAEGSLSQAETDKVHADFMAKLEQDFQAASGYKPNKADWLEGRWQGLEVASGEDRSSNTGVDINTLRDIGKALSRVPEGFNINPKIAKQLEAKREMAESGEGIDWATAEALAFGSLVVEGTPVRLSGQDCGRGTFSQRHSVLYDQTDERRFVPLNGLRADQASYEVHDSPLSEAAVMGFDYGFSLAEPNALVCWEGQFGDFANTAQVIIDQFISSAEAKWLRMSGFTLLLPHGYEGQGPEHSSARLERFLQMCGENNMQVANCSTPANYFHILRRQVRRNFRKPLVIMTPKSLLRHKLCVSKLTDMATDTFFRRIIGENAAYMADDKKIRRVVMCSGKIYYDLLAAREERKMTDVAIVRLEQFYPFPDKLLGEELGRYPKADIIWCQEEPQNMGGWTFVDRRIEGVLTDIGHKAKRPVYAGRAEGAATATGSLKRHNKEQMELIEKALEN
ncbi:MAG: 2-oxoglutarate dehydrogenase E1 component [Alphaproteobacteria bacterium]|nr:2-oxoglutarate dehydrogenase E1 component [Alphaproteobacteria bacterium]